MKTPATVETRKDSALIWIIRGITIMLVLIYAIVLYIDAATASIGESYQPGIKSVQLICSPGWILVGLLVLTFCSRSSEVAYMSMVVSGAAVVICIVMFYLISTYREDYSYNEVPRYLFKTVKNSITNPSFSNRSYISIIYSGIVAIFAWIATSRIYKSR